MRLLPDFRRSFLVTFPVFCLFSLGEIVPVSAQESTGPNLISDGGMNSFSAMDDPWWGVRTGVLQQIPATQRAVNDAGKVQATPFSSSVAIGDLNGDGLLDLVVADPRGYFWFYPNSGTKTEPKFTTGEVMPLWLGELADVSGHLNPVGSGYDNVAPRIALIDFDGDHKLDLVVGTYSGKLFYIRNSGSSSEPRFSIPMDCSLSSVPTRTDGRLWTTFLSPYLYDWFGSNNLDLIVGEGGYSANSIFLYRNKGTSASPIFNDATRVRLVPGIGREQLTPQVVDWNHDGKPDILTGERTGAVDLFLNITTDPTQPTFDAGQHVKFGGQETFGGMTTVTTGLLSGVPDVPDVIIGDNTNHLFFAHNTGTPGHPLFPTRPTPIKGMNPEKKLLVSSDWGMGNRNFSSSGDTRNQAGFSLGGPYGVPYELLTVENSKQTPNLDLPQSISKNVLHYYVMEPHSRYFPQRYYPVKEDDTQAHSINYVASKISLTSETDYQISFWIKSSNIHDLVWEFNGIENGPSSYIIFTVSNPVSVNSSWEQVTDTVSWQHHYDKDHVAADFNFDFLFYGQGDLQVTDVKLVKKDR